MTEFNKTIKKSSKIITLLFGVLCLAICLSFAELFSSLITVGGFYNTSKDNTIKQNSFSLYAISVFSTETKIQAKEMSELIRRKNGAGYIWQTDKNYLVLTSCYENEADAQKVSNNLKESNTDNQIIKIDFDSITIKTSTVEQEKSTLENSVQSYKNLYKKLYDLSVSVDTNLLSEIKAKVDLSVITSDFAKTKSSFESLFNSRLTSSLLELKLSLNNVSNMLSELSDFSSNEIPYTSQIKYTYFQILDEYKSLAKNL